MKPLKTMLIGAGIAAAFAACAPGYNGDYYEEWDVNTCSMSRSSTTAGVWDEDDDGFVTDAEFDGGIPDAGSSIAGTRTTAGRSTRTSSRRGPAK